MKILFICKHNRFRSKVGEALFSKYAQSHHQVKSAGVELRPLFPYVAPLVKKVLATYGIASVVDAPTPISDALIAWADRIIVVANDVDVSPFPPNVTDVWPVTDCSQEDEQSIILRVREINDRVRNLLHELVKERR